MTAYMTARSRALEHASGTVRLLSQRDHLYTEAALLERELEIFRSMRSRKPPRQRTHYSPEERGEILTLMALRHWSPKKTAQRFGVHANTIRSWMSALDDELGGDRRIGAAPWNKLHESVRWLVHEIRRLCPEPEFGTRTIARHIIRGGIQISRSSVRRILLEEVVKPKRPAKRRPGKSPAHIQYPAAPNRVWHMDMTDVRVLWMKFEVAVLLDGFTRKIVAMKAFKRRPRTTDLVKLVGGVVSSGGVAPAFLVTDHGSQFRAAFRKQVEAIGITHVRCSVGTWHLNAKVERVNRSLKSWLNRAMLLPSTNALQRKLDAYMDWHNNYRPHAAHGTLTPCEVEQEIQPKTPELFTQEGDVQPLIGVKRMAVKGEPRLAYMRITVQKTHKTAA